MATCWAILNNNDFDERMDDQLGCISTLADLAVNSKCLTISTDAVTLINRLQREKPTLQSRLKKACDAATQRFIARQLKYNERGSNFADWGR